MVVVLCTVRHAFADGTYARGWCKGSASGVTPGVVAITLPLAGDVRPSKRSRFLCGRYTCNGRAEEMFLGTLVGFVPGRLIYFSCLRRIFFFTVREGFRFPISTCTSRMVPLNAFGDSVAGHGPVGSVRL